jgi:hypothetical protein
MLLYTVISPEPSAKHQPPTPLVLRCFKFDLRFVVHPSQVYAKVALAGVIRLDYVYLLSPGFGLLKLDSLSSPFILHTVSATHLV